VTTTDNAPPRPSDETVILPRVADATVFLPRVTDEQFVPPQRSRPGPPLAPVPGTEPAPRRRPRVSADVLLALGLTVVVLAVQAWNITGFPFASDDEGTYLAQSWAVRHNVGLAHYTYWYDHPPLGWIQLAGLAWIPSVLLPDALAVGAGRLAMLPVSAVSLLLVYTIVRRLDFPRWTAALALLCYGLSPISVTMMRQIYLDSFAVMWILAAFALALSPRRHLWHHTAAGVAAAVAVLSKETMLIAVPGVVLALWQGTSRTPVRPWAFGGFLSGLVLVGVFYPLYAILKGELIPGAGHVSLIGAWQFQLGHRQGSGSIFTSGTNSNTLLQSWLFYDWVLPIVGVAATLPALAVRRLRGPALSAALLILTALRPGGYLPAMYVVQVLPFLAITLAGTVGVLAGMALKVRLPGALGARWLRITALGAAAVAVLALVAPQWYVGDRRAIVSDDNGGYLAAATWLRSGIPDRAHTTVVVDDVLWLDLVDRGYTRDHVIWFYKLDLDSAVAARLPHGWRDIDYIVSTPAVRQDVKTLPTVEQLLLHSTAVQTFGSGDGRIEVRRVKKEES
jgi:4-amino-4-deoxy-L-arabinose transferase-like glycosyltransferase